MYNISFASGSQREPHFQWNIGGGGSSGVGHVHFMYISCCLCIIFRVGYARISRRRGEFQWNMGLSGKVLFFKIPHPYNYYKDFVAMETTVVLNYVLKTDIAIITFFFLHKK